MITMKPTKNLWNQCSEHVSSTSKPKLSKPLVLQRGHRGRPNASPSPPTPTTRGKGRTSTTSAATIEGRTTSSSASHGAHGGALRRLGRWQTGPDEQPQRNRGQENVEASAKVDNTAMRAYDYFISSGKRRSTLT